MRQALWQPTYVCQCSQRAPTQECLLSMLLSMLERSPPQLLTVSSRSVPPPNGLGKAKCEGGRRSGIALRVSRSRFGSAPDNFSAKRDPFPATFRVSRLSVRSPVAFWLFRGFLAEPSWEGTSGLLWGRWCPLPSGSPEIQPGDVVQYDSGVEMNLPVNRKALWNPPRLS